MIGAKPWKRPSLNQLNSEIVYASRQANGLTQSKQEQEVPPPRPKLPEKPPQFYFGQQLLRPVSQTEKTLAGIESENAPPLPPPPKQTAIDKVKNNEAVSHPKNIVVNPGYRIKEYVDPSTKSGKPVFNFGDKPTSVVGKSPSSNEKYDKGPASLMVINKVEKKDVIRKEENIKIVPQAPTRATLDKNAKLNGFDRSAAEPKIQPVVINYSRFAANVPPPPKDSEFRVPRPKTNYDKPDLIKSVNINKKKSEMQKDSSELRRSFEAELTSGKLRLKSVGTSGIQMHNNDNDDSGSSGSGPSMIMPPPPPPPQFGNDSLPSNIPPPPPPISTIPAAPPPQAMRWVQAL